MQPDISKQFRIPGMNTPLACTFIIVTLTIDAMGIGLIIHVMPDLVQDSEGGELGQEGMGDGAR